MDEVAMTRIAGDLDHTHGFSEPLTVRLSPPDLRKHYSCAIRIFITGQSRGHGVHHTMKPNFLAEGL
jgi:hypothetical protein